MAATSRRGMLREYLGGALWAGPMAAVAVSLIAGAALSQIEVDPDSGFGRLLFQGDASSARELLIVVSATMITVTGLVFSLTVVALQISSTQFSPRLLRTFLRDRGTQAVLSVFVSTFAYAIAGLYTVGRVDDDGTPFVPRVAISVGMLLALGSVAAFVWYLHHLAHSIQIDDVMRRLERAIVAVIDRTPHDADDSPLPDPPASAVAVPSPSSGYVQALFPDEVLAAATTAGVTVRYTRMVGEHIVEGATIAHVWGSDAVDNDHAGTIAHDGVRVGFERTFEQDTAFGIRQLADIALRAMSRAINDPYTAEQAIYHLSVVLCEAVGGNLGPQIWRDASGAPRVLVPNHGLADHLDLACGQLRRVSAYEPRIIGALLGMLAEVATRVAGTAAFGAIRREADLLVDDARRATVQPADLAAVEAAYEVVVART